MSLQLTQWAHCYHCMVSSSGDLTNSSQQAHHVSCKLMESSQQAHSVSYKLTERSLQAHSVSHLVSSLWGNWVSSKWAFGEFQCELPVSYLRAQILLDETFCLWHRNVLLQPWFCLRQTSKSYEILVSYRSVLSKRVYILLLSNNCRFYRLYHNNLRLFS